LQLHWHPPKLARNLAKAGLGWISKKRRIPDSGTTILIAPETRVHKNPFLKKSPTRVGFFWVLSGFIGFI